MMAQSDFDQLRMLITRIGGRLIVPPSVFRAAAERYGEAEVRAAGLIPWEYLSLTFSSATE
jgi:hypothetical protein